MSRGGNGAYACRRGKGTHQGVERLRSFTRQATANGSSENREELAAWERRIEAFLSAHLGLRLNERRKLRPVSDGIDFLGYIVRPDYLLVRGRVVDALICRWASTN